MQPGKSLAPAMAAPGAESLFRAGAVSVGKVNKTIEPDVFAGRRLPVKATTGWCRSAPILSVELSVPGKREGKHEVRVLPVVICELAAVPALPLPCSSESARRLDSRRGRGEKNVPTQPVRDRADRKSGRQNRWFLDRRTTAGDQACVGQRRPGAKDEDAGAGFVGDDALAAGSEVVAANWESG